MALASRPPPSTATRPVLYQLGRVGDRFVPGDEPVSLHGAPRPLTFSRKDADSEPAPGRVFVDDPWMSLNHARIVDGARLPTHAGVPSPQRLFIEDLGSKNGVVVNGSLTVRAPLIHGDIIETGRTFWVFVEDREAEQHHLLSSAVEVGAFVTWHPRLGAQLQHLVSRAGSTDHAFICGPDGAGKGFLARTLHQVSRRDGRFLHLDCAERRPRKIAVDLFGKDGVAGRLRDAGKGTLLLEHVDALPLELQLRLADALRKKTLPGDLRSRPAPLEARVVATCSGSPRHHIDNQVLDQGFVDVLSSIRVDLLPLHERLCDLGLLLDDFLTRAKGATSISREACRVLFRHRFSQHVRGFARVVEAAASLAAHDTIDNRGDRGDRGDRGATGRKGGIVNVEHLPFCVAGTDAMRALLSQAHHLAVAGADNPELTSHELPVLSTTGADGAPFMAADSGDDGGFSSVVATETEHPPLSVSSDGSRRRGTASVLDADVFANVDEVDGDALHAALSDARGNVAAAARALGRPRAIVLRWLRDLGMDPLNYR